MSAFLLAAFTTRLSAQKPYNFVRIGVGAGASNYLGDLDDDLTFKFTKPGVSLTAAYRFNPHMAIRGGFYRGTVTATDDKSRDIPRRRRNLDFKSPITEMNLTLQVDFVPTTRRYNFRPGLTPYLFGGIAFYNFNPMGQNASGEWIALEPLGTEGQRAISAANSTTGKAYPTPYSLTQFAIPMGVGVRFRLTKALDIEAETGFRKLFTDYLDDVSGQYPDPADLPGSLATYFSDKPMIPGEVGADGVNYATGVAFINGKRGNTTQNDWYIYSNVTVSYIIDWVKCPKFK